MREALLEVLVDPISKTPLDVEAREYGAGHHIVEGILRGPGGRTYVIRNGIPRLVLTVDHDQRRTGDSFRFKWQQRSTYDTPHMHRVVQDWLAPRYGFRNLEEMRGFFGSRRLILDAGCGSGFSSSFWMDPAWRTEGAPQWFGAELSEAIDVAQERLGHIAGTHFIQTDILQLPFRLNTFDTIYSEGVLHHTPSTELALKSLICHLEPGGQVLFYVYRKKGPIREFADDHVRAILSEFEPQDAWARLRPLTALARALSNSGAEVEVPEDIPYLGIKAGRYEVQRLLYWHFAKLYWNDNLSFEENNHVNFDWYHPRYAHRHTEAEIRRWCEECCLSIIHFDEQESGFTVRAEAARG